MWGCMGWEGVGYATRIEDKMDAQLYTGILGDELLKSLEWFRLNVEDIYFQQDNDPKHTSKMTNTDLYCLWCLKQAATKLFECV